MPRARVLHYINQFFAGGGGEDKADVPVDFRPGALGPGKRLQELLKDSAEIVATVYCGDNYFTNHTAEALEAIVRIARDQKVNLLVAGPAFASGRYGFACAEVCHAVSSALAIDCVTAMYPENPGVETYKQYKNHRVYAFPTTEVVSGMNEALSKIGQFVDRLASGANISTPSVEGYITRGFRLDEVAAESGAVRAVRMLVDKMAGRPFSTEIPMESLESIPVPPKITNLKDVHLALVTTSGVIPVGNPDGVRGYQNTKWAKYSIEKLNSMLDAPWDALHGGYNTEFVKKNPNYGVPLDVCRDMEKEGVVHKLYDHFYATPGARGLISVMHRLGKEMFDDMKEHGVNAVLLVST